MSTLRIYLGYWKTLVLSVTLHRKQSSTVFPRLLFRKKILQHRQAGNTSLHCLLFFKFNIKMKIRSIPRKSPVDKSISYYPQGIKQGIISTKLIADEIAGRCSLTKGDVLNVFSNLQEVLPKYLNEGYCVKLDDIGTFRVTLKSTGAESAEKCTAKNIKRPVVHCICDKQLRLAVTHNITYEKVSDEQSESA